MTTHSSHWRLLSRTAGYFAAGTGVVVLVGWAFDIPVLKGFYADITMKANAAVCLVLAGVSLLLVGARGGRQNARALGVGFALSATLIGALTLLEHLSGWNIGIDQLLFREPPGERATASPGQMGINASTSFMLCGTALFSL